jgi:succinate dehydrogenase / fumarate reductase cytochrome b subunit
VALFTAARSWAVKDHVVEDPDRPWSLEAIIEACASRIDYPAKIKCCGFPIIQARGDGFKNWIQPIEQAMDGRGRDGDAVPAVPPVADAWQSKLRATTGRDFSMPILHLSQLIGVAAGFEESELKFKRHVVSVQPVLEKLQA